jgi:hypothetical protein
MVHGLRVENAKIGGENANEIPFTRRANRQLQVTVRIALVPDGAVRDGHSPAVMQLSWIPAKNSAGGVREEIGGRSTQECLANSGANSFAAADLTLMRSLRIKNAAK